MIEKSKLSSRFKKKLEKTAVIKKETVIPEIKKIEITENVSQISDEIKKEFLEKVYSIPVWFDYSPDEQKDLIKSFVLKKGIDANIDEAVKFLYDEISDFGILNHLITQENVSAVLVNGTKSVHIEIAGKILNTEIKLTAKELQFLVNSIIHIAGAKSDKPILDLKIGNCIVSLIMPEISSCGTNIIIRKNIFVDYRELIEEHFITEEMFNFITSAIKAGKNIVISGDVNSGKTNFLSALIDISLKNKRIVLLEAISQIASSSDNWFRFLIDKNSKYYDLLISDVLKMVPEYVVSDFNSQVPECLGAGANILTLRASGIEAAIMKLTAGFITFENLPEKNAKMKVLRNYDYIVQINKSSNGLNKVTKIVELSPAKTLAQSVKIIFSNH